jgi:hypothetical protein
MKLPTPAIQEEITAASGLIITGFDAGTRRRAPLLLTPKVGRLNTKV